MGGRVISLAVMVLLAVLQIAAYTPELPPTTIGTCGSGCAIDWSKNTYYVVSSLTASTTLAFTAPAFSGSSLTLEMCQNSSGSNTVSWPGNVLDGGLTSPRVDAIFPMQASTCGAVNLQYDGTNYYITGKPDLISNCSHSATLSTGTQTASNLCCASTSNVFVCHDISNAANGCHAQCDGAGTITMVGTGTDIVVWERLW